MRGSTKWRSGEAGEETVGAVPNKKERDFDGWDGWKEQVFSMAWCVGVLAGRVSKGRKGYERETLGGAILF